MPIGTTMRVGLSLTSDRAVAVVLGRNQRVTAEATFDASNVSTTISAALIAVKADLESSLGRSTDGTQVEVALFPPLADARIVPLPPLNEAELASVLERDIGRYFLGGNEAQVVAFRSPTRRTPIDGERSAVLVSAAGRTTLEAIRAGVDAVGWKCARLESAHGVWLSQAQSVDALLAVEGTAAHLIHLADGDPKAIRRLPADDAKAIANAAGTGPGRMLLLAPPDRHPSLAAALERAGWVVQSEPSGWTPTAQGTASAVGSGTLELVPPTVRLERQGKRQRNARTMVAATAFLLVAAFVAVQWGSSRELAAVQARRAAISDQVAPLLAARDTLRQLQEQVDAVEGLRGATIRWVPALVELSVLLPGDTYLTALFASGDTIELEAAGEQAGQAIQALREAGLLEDVRLDGVVERELEDGATVSERFRVRGRLAGRAKGGSGR